MRQPHLFTLDEAIGMLPRVQDLLLDIQSGKAELDQQSIVLDALLVMTTSAGHLKDDIERSKSQITSLANRLEELIRSLLDLGAELKGIDEGLVDFPSDRDGEVVYLCWRLGEATITWWHDVDSGFAGRKPL